MNLLDLFGGAGGTDEVRAVATALAGMERDLHDAVQDHYRALGVDPPADQQPTGERIDQLCRLVEHHFDNDLWGYYVTEQAPDSLMNAEVAREHAGKSDAEWQATVAEWAEAAPQVGDADGDGVGDTASDTLGSDAERVRADHVARERFGVDLEAFEHSVVEWSRERTLKNALRTPIDSDVQRIRLTTEVIEDLRG